MNIIETSNKINVFLKINLKEHCNQYSNIFFDLNNLKNKESHIIFNNFEKELINCINNDKKRFKQEFLNSLNNENQYLIMFYSPKVFKEIIKIIDNKNINKIFYKKNRINSENFKYFIDKYITEELITINNNIKNINFVKSRKTDILNITKKFNINKKEINYSITEKDVFFILVFLDKININFVEFITETGKQKKFNDFFIFEKIIKEYLIEKEKEKLKLEIDKNILYNNVVKKNKI